MNYIIHLLTLSFIQLALSTTPTWKMSYTTQEITTSDSKPIQSELHFQATSIRTYTDVQITISPSLPIQQQKNANFLFLLLIHTLL